MTNIVIITSIINAVSNPLSYTSCRSIYTQKQRYEQSLNSIMSIRKHIKNSYIIYAEYSNVDKEYDKNISDEVDTYLNFYDNTHVRNIVESRNKGHGESVLLINVIEYIIKNKFNYDNVYKLSGRYQINNDYDFDKINNNGRVTCTMIENQKDNICTIFFKISASQLNDYYKFHLSNQSKFSSGVGAEVMMGSFVSTIENVCFVDKIGAEGRVAVSGDLVRV